MAKFFLTNKALEDLNEIWKYTVEEWSETQAEIYYNLLLDTCEILAKKPNQCKKYDIVDQNLLGFKSGQHLIFYKIVSDKEIEVIRILHSLMDLKYHI